MIRYVGVLDDHLKEVRCLTYALWFVNDVLFEHLVKTRHHYDFQLLDNFGVKLDDVNNAVDGLQTVGGYKNVVIG